MRWILAIVTTGLVLALVVASCGSSHSSNGPIQPIRKTRSFAASASAAAPLTVVEVKTPPLGVAGIVTGGTYPQVTGSTADLRAVNAALQDAILTSQRAYGPYARRERKTLDPDYPAGSYRTTVDRGLISASSVVVSVLLPVRIELYQGQPGTPGWLAKTVPVPSGKEVRITDLFNDPDRGLRVLARAWKARVRRGWRAACVNAPEIADEYAQTARNYGVFALTPSGLAVGANNYECHGLFATVPYRIVRPYLSKLGVKLIAGVRRPQFQRTRGGGRHGTGIVSGGLRALPSGEVLSPDTENTVTADTDLGFAVTVQDTGDWQEARVKVTLTILQGQSPIVQTKTIDLINPAEQQTITFRNLGAVTYATLTTVKVDVQPVPGEENRANNFASYPVIFTLG
jgi:hypothetical protein